MTEEPQKQLIRNMIAFTRQMKRFEEEFAQPDKSLQSEEGWAKIAVPAAKLAPFIAAYEAYEKLPPRDQKARMELIGDGLDETFDIDEKRSPKEQVTFVQQQALFLIDGIIKCMRDGMADEIINAPVDAEGLKIFAAAAAEERKEREARKASRSSVPDKKANNS